jgi:hypothetical protein
MHKELRKHLAKEFRYVATKMQQEKLPQKKLFYFSALFGESQRVLNYEWDRDLALVHMVIQQTHIHLSSQAPSIGTLLPIDGSIIYQQLTQTTLDLAEHFEKPEDIAKNEELYQILSRIAEIAYVASGNGSYLYEKGAIKF